MQAAVTAEGLEPAFWRETLAPYAKPDVRRALLDVATSVVPYLGLTALMYAALQVSALLVVALAIPATGFLVRTFIVFHDCAHGSFLPWRRANTLLGVGCGLLVYSPFHAWRHEHAIHHATAGDLDRRGMGDVDTLTVAEYANSTPAQQLGYRLMRNPLVLLGVGPLWALILEPRLVPSWARKRFARKIVATDVALVVVLGALCALAGWRAVLLIQLVPALLAGAVGIWLFYVQHQFEDVYWERKEEWCYAASALRGSSHLRLPKPLQFFTGNIGLHHVHHLQARIPNYNLQRAHDDNPVFHDVRELGIWEAIVALRLKLYDETSGRLVTFAQARA
ncbi:MAG TPA: fatty acid desaturase [Solirubrobacteraceae bacterium]|jgi:omega-6 fatty acid desaturase (delta-12 desaturase)|nr:fatty acid desaturase [Solirubrobacteraceae bacterium]